MRRSPTLVVAVLCPHFERPVQARRNAVTERLVDCAEKQSCVTTRIDELGVEIVVRPVGCPVFPHEAAPAK